MKVSTLIKKLLPYADKNLVFSAGPKGIRRLPGPVPVEDEAGIYCSGIYVLPDHVEIYLEADCDD